MLFDQDQHEHQDYATIEHVVPKALGGSKNRLSNLALSHRRCNNLRGQLLNRQLQGQSIVRGDPEGEPLGVATHHGRRARDRLFALNLSLRPNRS